MLVPREPPLPEDSTLQSDSQATRQRTSPPIALRCTQKHIFHYWEHFTLLSQPPWSVTAHLVMRNSWFPAHCEGLRALLAMLLSRSSST